MRSPTRLIGLGLLVTSFLFIVLTLDGTFGMGGFGAQGVESSSGKTKSKF